MNYFNVVLVFLMIIAWIVLTATIVYSFQEPRREKKKSEHKFLEKFFAVAGPATSIIIFIGIMILLPSEGPQRSGTQLTVAMSHFAIGRFVLKIFVSLIITSLVYGSATVSAWIISRVITTIRDAKTRQN